MRWSEKECIPKGRSMSLEDLTISSSLSNIKYFVKSKLERSTDDIYSLQRESKEMSSYVDDVVAFRRTNSSNSNSTNSIRRIMTQPSFQSTNGISNELDRIISLSHSKSDNSISCSKPKPCRESENSVAQVNSLGNLRVLKYSSSKRFFVKSKFTDSSTLRRESALILKRKPESSTKSIEKTSTQPSYQSTEDIYSLQRESKDETSSCEEDAVAFRRESGIFIKRTSDLTSTQSSFKSTNDLCNDSITSLSHSISDNSICTNYSTSCRESESCVPRVNSSGNLKRLSCSSISTFVKSKFTDVMTLKRESEGSSTKSFIGAKSIEKPSAQPLYQRTDDLYSIPRESEDIYVDNEMSLRRESEISNERYNSIRRISTQPSYQSTNGIIGSSTHTSLSPCRSESCIKGLQNPISMQKRFPRKSQSEGNFTEFRRKSGNTSMKSSVYSIKSYLLKFPGKITKTQNNIDEKNQNDHELIAGYSATHFTKVVNKMREIAHEKAKKQKWLHVFLILKKILELEIVSLTCDNPKVAETLYNIGIAISFLSNAAEVHSNFENDLKILIPDEDKFATALYYLNMTELVQGGLIDAPTEETFLTICD